MIVLWGEIIFSPKKSGSVNRGRNWHCPIAFTAAHNTTERNLRYFWAHQTSDHIQIIFRMYQNNARPRRCAEFIDCPIFGMSTNSLCRHALWITLVRTAKYKVLWVSYPIVNNGSHLLTLSRDGLVVLGRFSMVRHKTTFFIWWTRCQCIQHAATFVRLSNSSKSYATSYSQHLLYLSVFNLTARMKCFTYLRQFISCKTGSSGILEQTTAIHRDLSVVGVPRFHLSLLYIQIRSG